MFLGKGKGKGGTDDDAEARADGDADTIETTEEKGKSKKGSKETTDDIEAKTDVVEATEVKVKKCKKKNGCEVEDEEIASHAEESVAEAVSVATEEPSKVSKVSKMSSDETEVRTIVWGLS